MKRYWIVGTTVVLIAVVAVGLVITQNAEAQSGSRVQGGRVVAQRPFEARFWDYLQQSNYKNWAPGPRQNGDFYEGESPHGAFLKMYLNRTAIANPNTLPHGSIVIKENYGPDKNTLMAITMMYRSKGYHPEHNDWYWVKYNPDGSVAKAPPEMGSMPLKGKVNGCINCHGGADGNDFTFIND